MSDEQPLYSDDGELVGWAVEATDGAIVAFDATGTEIVGALDPTSGQLVDHTAYQVEDDFEDPRAAELEQQMAMLEQRLEQPREVVHRYEEPALDEQAVHDQWHRERQILESPGGLGRPLTSQEVVQLASEAAADGHFSLIAAAEARADRGDPLRDVDVSHPGRAHEQRVALAGELLAERTENVDPMTGMPPRTSELYDGSTHAGRMEAYEDALAGHDVSGRVVDDASYETPEDDWSEE